ncbi:MAG: AAA family ATPase [Syntrophales bacterium]|nr:AAA family ATPase [Syntrophales bacterium]
MFFTSEQITSSIAALVDVHPFHGITFLVCKKAELPVGQKIVFPIDSETDSFLRQYHRIDPASDWFFQPFKSIKKWVRPDYSAKGLQSINTQTFGRAFLHDPNTRIWGWAPNYVSILASRLPKKKRIPVFHLSVWLYKEEDWPGKSSVSDIIDRFVQEFHITNEEKRELFNISPPQVPSIANIFQVGKASWYDLRKDLPPPPDAKPDQGGTLAYLETWGLGPAEHFVLEPADRLTLITGDNGLGKSFLLECAWWALTGEWADMPAFPNPGKQRGRIEIKYAIEGEHGKSEKKSIVFDWKSLSWPQNTKRPTIPGLIVYARVDGSFAVWDPAQQLGISSNISGANSSVFTSKQVWDGKHGRIEGLIRDWIRWQNNPSKYPFETFTRVLARLSPPDLGTLEPGEPVRIPGDPRDIPTIKHPYGVTPIVYDSAGVRRIITLAYLIVWAWNEHIVTTELTHAMPERRIVVLVDEMEAHLHPRWQRAVLPALMSIGEMLAPQLHVQFLVATHSPLVMASAEPIFDEAIDSLFHLDLADTGEVFLHDIDFIRYGDISNWLTSHVFDLKQARSSEAESAIESAKAIQMQKKIIAEEVRDISSRLVKYLAVDDKFWPRWITFAEKFGVQL